MTETSGHLRFGVPSIDDLLPEPPLAPETGRKQGEKEKQRGARANGWEDRETICLVGPDGTGKSILALHLASYYAAGFCLKDGAPPPRVVYVSTDMKFARANAIWQAFHLGHPGKRAIPFEPQDHRDQRTKLTKPVKLAPFHPGEEGGIPDLLTRRGDQAEPKVGFLDLASYTAGDDWTYVARILRLGTGDFEGKQPEGSAEDPPKMMVIDSVAGFETLVGETDSFGEELSRRERISQIVRAAAGKWHLVFIVEDPKPGEHSAEEFVTDTVVRLRRNLVGVHGRLTLEVEKSRSRGHARGQHPFEIRSGAGSCNGNWQNADDPVARCGDERCRAKARRLKKPDSNAYIQVFPSLQWINEKADRERGRLPEVFAPNDRTVGFDIEYLDDMLAKGKVSRGARSGERSDSERHTRGLRAGSVTAVLGDDGTYKSPLGRYFLMGCFRDYAGLLRAVLRLVANPEKLEPSDQEALDWALGKFFGTNADLDTIKRRLNDDLPDFIDDVRAVAQVRRICSQAYEQSFGGYDGRYAQVDTSKMERGLSELLLGRVPKAPIKTLLALAREDRGKYMQKCLDTFSLAPRTAPPTKSTDRRKRRKASEERDSIPRSRICFPDPWMAGPQPGSSRKVAYVRLVNWLFEHPLLAEPAVLLTTADERAGVLAKRFTSKLIKPVLDKFGLFREGDDDPGAKGQSAYALCARTIARQIICRRVPIHDASAPLLIHIVEKSLDEAMTLRFGRDSAAVSTLDLSAKRSWKTRVVVDDLRVMSGMFPEVNEELYLPYLIFRLRRRGVTSLLIGTYAGRPDAQPRGIMDAGLRALTGHQINTWRVSFHGRNRVAVAVNPAMSPPPAHSDVVRELRAGDEDGSMELEVDPHFELYSGIAGGKPEAIPLEIRLFNETEAFAKYLAEEEGFWRQRFTPFQPSQKVLKGVDAQELNDLRTLCQLPQDETRPNTLVYQVDGYWALDSKALLDRRTYLTGELPPEDKGKRSQEDKGATETRYVDPFGLFRPTAASADDQRPTPPDSGKRRTRLDYFNNDGYACRISSDDHLNRVPFMWDFGFLLCRKEAWERARGLELKIRVGQQDVKGTVEDVWKLFAQPSLQKGAGSFTGWRPFLQACKLVAHAESQRLSRPVPAFDLNAISPDSVGCLILEIWASEIYNEMAPDRQAQFLSQVSGKHLMNSVDAHRIGPEGLIQWLEEDDKESLASHCESSKHTVSPKFRKYFPALYRTWLLLTEVLDFASFLNKPPGFHFAPGRRPDPYAVAARHWYKTACSEQTGEPEADRDVLLPVALPGHFSSRGDWHLAAAAGSRSERLADIALDLLVSRRANFARLQGGMGLPVRDLVAEGCSRVIRTPILKSRDPVEEATYGDIIDLGGRFRDERVGSEDRRRPDLYWLWRCGLADYDRQSRVWGSWLHRLFEWTVSYRSNPTNLWPRGFSAYDASMKGDWKMAFEGTCFRELGHLSDVLIAGLKQASPPRSNT